MASFCHCPARSNASSLRSQRVSSTATRGRVWALVAIVVLAGCASDSGTTSTAVPVEPSASTSTTQPDASFPTAPFTAMSEDELSEGLADELLAILTNMAPAAVE